MKSADESPKDSCAPEFDPKAACEECGSYGVYVFDGHRLCAECCSTRGACCAEREERDGT